MIWLYQYLLFLIECLTIALVVIIIPAFIFMRKKKTDSASGEIETQDLTEKYKVTQEQMLKASLNHDELKKWEKEQKNQKKKNKKQKKMEVIPQKPFLYVISFQGSVDAREVDSLRQEITAILSIINQNDEVLIKLESPGGIVNGYGLAASQLMRFKEKKVPLTIAVDKVAASGGYMMACVANTILAAPFAIIGSIGVVAQVPNVHRLLKKHDVDVELHTAGQYKRTITLLGENTEEGRVKFKQELEETHDLFKAFVHENRPELDMNRIATGEHWYGSQAKELGLIDSINTSDDFLLSKIETHKIIAVRYCRKKKLSERMSLGFITMIDRYVKELIYKGNNPLM